MRSRYSLLASLLLILSTLLLNARPAHAADDTNDDEYEEHARVLRVSLLKGDVTLKRDGGDEWEAAQLNTPVVEGDTLATGRDARLEIQVDSRNFVRVGENSVLKIVTVRDEGIALSLSEGTATVRLARFDREREYFEIDAPKTTIAAERNGQYRVDVDASGGVRVTVRADGRARVYSETSGFELRSDRTARLAYDSAQEGDWELGSPSPLDEWDNWNDERERYLASHLNYEGRERFYDPEVYGAEELDSYGDWNYTADYGYVWRPRVTVINNYYDWAPYRYGHWDWCPPYGWTWVADEQWGWAPYHYGRWVFVNNYWCWAPRGYGYTYRHAWWRPALVAFVNVDFGSERHVAWYPLTYGQRDPRGRWWSRRFDPHSPLRGGEGERPWHPNPAIFRAVTSVPEREFGGGRLRPRPAPADIAQRALASDPIRGRLPIMPDSLPRVGPRRFETDGRANGSTAQTQGGRTTRAGSRDVLTINRPAPVMPPRALPERPTGAAPRTPGLSLDGDLRRTRFFGNREPRVATPSTDGGTQSREDNTGAVERRHSNRRPVEGAGGGGENANPEPRTYNEPRTNNEPGTNGERRLNKEPRSSSSTPEGFDGNGTRRTRPARRPEEGTPAVQPNQDRPRDNPAAEPRVYRPEPRERRPDNGERETPRYEAPRQETPRQEAPRQEAPRREIPRQEAPRQEAPRQEAPRQQSPRQETPRQERPAQKDSDRPARPPRPDH